MCYGRVLCGSWLHCVLHYGGVLCVMAVYYVLWLRTVCSGGVVCVMTV